MGLFGSKKKAADETETTTTSEAVDLGKQSGKISLAKGSAVTIDKSDVIKARCTWSSATDYDLYALVLLKNGETLVVSTFGSQDQPNPTTSVLNGAVRHMGDVGRGAAGIAEETIEIRMTDEIEAVFPIAYSAQSNGTGSFHKYNVSCSIENGVGTEVTIDSDNASRHMAIFTLAIGGIYNTTNGVRIEALEKYSRMMSEKRPAIVKGKLVMDKGSLNLFK